jgi:hypothetical protein
MAAEFLSPVGTAYQIDRLISEANNEIVFCAPVLKLHESVILRFQQAVRKGAKPDQGAKVVQRVKEPEDPLS